MMSIYPQKSTNIISSIIRSTPIHNNCIPNLLKVKLYEHIINNNVFLQNYQGEILFHDLANVYHMLKFHLNRRLAVLNVHVLLKNKVA